MKKFLLLLTLTSCSHVNEYFGLEDDNIVEEVLEEVLEHTTDVDIDFTPGSPE